MSGGLVTLELDCIECGAPLSGVLEGDHVTRVGCGVCEARLDAAEDREADLAACRANHPTARGAR